MNRVFHRLPARNPAQRQTVPLFQSITPWLYFLDFISQTVLKKTIETSFLASVPLGSLVIVCCSCEALIEETNKALIEDENQPYDYSTFDPVGNPTCARANWKVSQGWQWNSRKNHVQVGILMMPLWILHLPNSNVKQTIHFQTMDSCPSFLGVNGLEHPFCTKPAGA